MGTNRPCGSYTSAVRTARPSTKRARNVRDIASSWLRVRLIAIATTEARVDILIDDLTSPEIEAFVREHLRQMHARTPSESVHALALDELRLPGVIVWSVKEDDEIVGCGALKRLCASHAELKSMRTIARRRRGGIASGLLTHIIDHARNAGFSRLSLETGSSEFFLPARKLYEKFGFAYCDPFADYRPDPNSVFMTRSLAKP